MASLSERLPFNCLQILHLVDRNKGILWLTCLPSFFYEDYIMSAETMKFFIWCVFHSSSTRNKCGVLKKWYSIFVTNFFLSLQRFLLVSCNWQFLANILTFPEHQIYSSYCSGKVKFSIRHGLLSVSTMIKPGLYETWHSRSDLNFFVYKD